MPGRTDPANDNSPPAALLDIREIVKRLPHRFPFLLVDRVLEFEDGKRIVALKNVTVNEPFFTGHFPGRPIMPGVLICEAMLQAGGLLASCSLHRDPTVRVQVVAGLDRVRFRRPVEPGDQLRLEIDVIHRRLPLWRFRGRALVDGRLAAEAEFMNVEVDEPPPIAT